MMSSLFPQWMPAWTQAVLLVGGMLFTLLWMLVPFAVFGVKGRLDNLAIQLDDLQAELRVLALGLNGQSAQQQPPAVADALTERVPAPTSGDASVWEPAPPVDMGPEERSASRDIPAYERRVPRARPAPSPSWPAAPAPVAPAPHRPMEEDAWPPTTPSREPSPAQPYVPRRPEPSYDAGAEPGLADWSREPVRPAAPRVTPARPVRASVWPPERRTRAEPTLRWPPRPE